MGKIKFTRGDTYPFYFERHYTTEDGEQVPSEETIIKTLPEKMWFTVKSNYNSRDVLIQYTLEDNTIQFDPETFRYYITFQPEDTANLRYKAYVYDIQIKTSLGIFTIDKGTVQLTEEATFEYE